MDLKTPLGRVSWGEGSDWGLGVQQEGEEPDAPVFSCVGEGPGPYRTFCLSSEVQERGEGPSWDTRVLPSTVRDVQASLSVQGREVPM